MTSTRRPKCPICSGEASDEVKTLLAPWFMVLSEASPDDGAIRMLKCQPCSFWWSDRGISGSEVAHVYSDYRGERYLKVRQKFEPWYRTKHNQDRVIKNHDSYRSELTPPEVDKFLASQTSLRILDFGGDSGQMVPRWTLNQEVSVVDESAKQRLDGVNSLRLEELSSRQFDVVLVMHVAEHLDDPVSQLQSLAAVLRCGGFMYVEVPMDGLDFDFRQSLLDRPAVSGVVHGIHARSLRFRLWRLVWVSLDFGVVLLQMFSPLKVRRLKISEHINFFSERALDALGEAIGLELTATISFSPSRAATSTGRAESVGCWYRKAEA